MGDVGCWWMGGEGLVGVCVCVCRRRRRRRRRRRKSALSLCCKVVLRETGGFRGVLTYAISPDFSLSCIYVGEIAPLERSLFPVTASRTLRTIFTTNRYAFGRLFRLRQTEAGMRNFHLSELFWGC